jgi:hypothetical protein
MSLPPTRLRRPQTHQRIAAGSSTSMPRPRHHGKHNSKFVTDLRTENSLDYAKIGLPLNAQNQSQRSKINLALLS